MDETWDDYLHWQTTNKNMNINWGTAILIFIILFLALSAVFVIFALKQNRDLVETDYYEKGANYSQQIEINKRSAIYNDSISIENEGKYLVLKANVSKSITTFDVYFFRPSDKTYDYRIQFPSTNTSMLIEKSKLTRGRYIVRLSWKSGNNVYMANKEVFVE